MAVALLGYFTTMVTGLLGFMLLLNVVLSSSYLRDPHQRPYPRPAIVEVEAEAQPALSARTNSAQTASVEAPKPAVTEKPKRPKMAARDQRRKQDFAGRQQDRDYAMGQRYAQNGWQSGGWQNESTLGQFGRF